jgi:hypothetical protein
MFAAMAGVVEQRLRFGRRFGRGGPVQPEMYVIRKSKAFLASRSAICQ